MAARFGSFQWICTNVPSYPYCNLFYRQLQKQGVLPGSSANHLSAPVGVNPICGIPRLGHGSKLGNIANTVVAGLSVFLVLYLVARAGRRRAAVARVEFRWLLLTYALTLVLQIIDLGSYLEQGSTALVVITSIHAGLVATLFWFLIANAFLATQIVEDGTPAAMLPFFIVGLFFFVATTFISLDTALAFTNTFLSSPPDRLQNIGLFVLLNIWPGVAVLIYLGITSWVVVGALKELRPLLYYLLALVLFALSQLAVFLLSKVVCQGTGQKIDGSFIATLLETAAVGVLFLGWRSITEDDWGEEVYYGN